jgi:hypothetical protein
MAFYRGDGGSGSGSVTSTPIPVGQGGTGATTAQDARTNLGVTKTGEDTTYAFRANNLSDLTSASTARSNLGLGTAATSNTGDFATAAQGTLADSAVQPGDLATVATSGDYDDLIDKPTLGTIASQAANNVSITGGSISGITDLAVADGGTGASTASAARTNLLPSYTSNANKVLAVNTGATDVEWITAGAGTVTSVDLSVPTGLAVSGNPITSSGTLAIAFASGYSIPTTTKQSNWDTAYTDRLKWDGGATGLDAATGRTSLGLGTAATTASTDYAVAAKGVTNGDSHDHSGGDGAQIAYSSLSGTPSLATVATTGNYTDLTNKPTLGTISSQDANNVSITGGSISGITDLAVADGGTGASTAANARVNLLPSYTGNGSKVLALNSGATDVEWVSNGNGTVTSVDMTVPTGLAVSGNPVTSSGTLAVTFAAGYSIPTTTKQGEWDTAYTDRLKWDGGATGLTASTGRTSLGATTVGSNIFTLTNPSAVTFIRMNADNTVSSRTASELKTDLSLNNVENTALSTWAGSSNITTVGTVSTGTISGGTYA